MLEKLNTHLLLGPQGLLDLHYTEKVLQQWQEQKSTLFDFFEIFNQSAKELLEHSIYFANDGMQALFKSEQGYFYYSNLFLLHVRSKQALRQFLSSYFSLKCEQIYFKALYVNLSAKTWQVFQSNSQQRQFHLGHIAKIGEFELICHFAQITYHQYQSLLQPRFRQELFKILAIYLKPAHQFCLTFFIYFGSSLTITLNQCALNHNAWLGKISAGTTYELKWHLELCI